MLERERELSDRDKVPPELVGVTWVSVGFDSHLTLAKILIAYKFTSTAAATRLAFSRAASRVSSRAMATPMRRLPFTCGLPKRRNAPTAERFRPAPTTKGSSPCDTLSASVLRSRRGIFRCCCKPENWRRHWQLVAPRLRARPVKRPFACCVCSN